ncbi:hypothetical protein FAI40_10495 (plasmid) [Acetobacteraceae bacterium]|nr:hypothetical protein FAI40_10495 [Acetobacteraceae bacterium]
MAFYHSMDCANNAIDDQIKQNEEELKENNCLISLPDTSTPTPSKNTVSIRSTPAPNDKGTYQVPFLLQLKTPLGKDGESFNPKALHAASFYAEETLSQPYFFKLKLFANEQNISQTSSFARRSLFSLNVKTEKIVISMVLIHICVIRC